MSWKVYRPGEGRIARLAALVAVLAMGAFAAYRWYLWAEKNELRWLLPRIGFHQLSWAEIGAAAIVIAFTLVGYRICFARPKSSDFLVETEIELRKVTWPEWKPPFRASTELWGSTYVVIVVIVALAVFIGLVDFGLGNLSDLVFLR